MYYTIYSVTQQFTHANIHICTHFDRVLMLNRWHKHDMHAPTTILLDIFEQMHRYLQLSAANAMRSRAYLLCCSAVKFFMFALFFESLSLADLKSPPGHRWRASIVA